MSGHQRRFSGLGWPALAYVLAGCLLVGGCSGDDKDPSPTPDSMAPDMGVDIGPDIKLGFCDDWENWGCQTGGLVGGNHTQCYARCKDNTAEIACDGARCIRASDELCKGFTLPGGPGCSDCKAAFEHGCY